MRLVSAIMPTRGRIEWAHRTLECFLAQTYPEKRLIILDTADDLSFPEVEWQSFPPNVVYAVGGDHLTISKKRNMCCKVVAGGIICHFDSDDWSAPDRMSQQVELMEESGKAVVGFHSMLFYDETTGQAYKYIGHNAYAIGTSLAYTKNFWSLHPFRAHPDTPTFGEDNLFMGEARQEDQLVSVDAGQLMVARIHHGSTSPHDLGGVQQSYRKVPVDAIPRGFFGE